MLSYRHATDTGYRSRNSSDSHTVDYVEQQMTRRGSERRRMPGQVLVRMTPILHDAVAARAQSEQLTIAAWLRRTISKVVDANPGPVRSRARAPELVIEIANLRIRIAELTDLLKTASIAAHQSGWHVMQDDIQNLLIYIRQAVSDLDRIKERLWPSRR